MGNSILQSIIGIREKFSHGGDIDARYGFFQRHQYQYLLNKSIRKNAHQVHSWPYQVLKHILVFLRDFLKNLYVLFYTVQGNSRLV